MKVTIKQLHESSDSNTKAFSELKQWMVAMNHITKLLLGFSTTKMAFASV